jgi:endonuclease VIII
MPEGDSIHRVAQRLQPLVGEKLEVETPHPRARVSGVASRLDGRRLLGVEAVGKNLLLRFEDGLVLRSHLRMRGRWQVLERNGPSTRRGMPWLVLRGESAEAILWHGPVLELDDTHVRRLGPDILADPPDLEEMLERIRASPSAKRCSTSGSSQGSGTCGAPRRSGGRRSRPGRGSASSRTTTSAASSRKQPS